MDDFFRIIAIVLVVIILGIFLKNTRFEISALLVLVASCMVFLFVADKYISPVFEFVNNIRSVSGLNSEFVFILIKSAGIGLISEIVSLLCADAGFAALGKVIKFTSVFVILWLSIPLLNELITLIVKVLICE